MSKPKSKQSMALEAVIPTWEHLIGKGILLPRKWKGARALVLDAFDDGFVYVEVDLGSGWPYRIFLGVEELGKTPKLVPLREMDLPFLLTEGPLHSFDRRGFTQLLANSLSLSSWEKERVIRELPNLTQFQVDELHKVFDDEIMEFSQIWPREREVIQEIQAKSRGDWDQIFEGMLRESRRPDLFALLSGESKGVADANPASLSGYMSRPP